MSRKNICILAGAVFAIAIYWLGFVNGVYYAENKTEVNIETEQSVSDMDALNRYVEDHYGSGYYADLYMVKDNYVYYDVYSEDGYWQFGLCTTHKSCLN